MSQRNLLSQVSGALRACCVFARRIAVFIFLLGMLLAGQLLGGEAAFAAQSEAASHESPAGSSSGELVSGAVLFETHCAGCHVGGGNIIRRGKNLKLKALKRYRLDETKAVAQLVTQGRGIMSAYGDRLSAAEIEAVSEYVLEQANAGWH